MRKGQGRAKENAPVGRALAKLRADPGRARRQEAREVADKMKDWLEAHAAKHSIHNHRGVIPHIVDVVWPRCAARSDALPAVRETVGLAGCCAILHSQRHVPVNPSVSACTGKLYIIHIPCMFVPSLSWQRIVSSHPWKKIKAKRRFPIFAPAERSPMMSCA